MKIKSDKEKPNVYSKFWIIYSVSTFYLQTGKNWYLSILWLFWDQEMGVISIFSFRLFIVRELISAVSFSTALKIWFHPFLKYRSFSICFYRFFPEWSLRFNGFTLSNSNCWEFCQLLLKNQSWQKVLYSAKIYI